MCLISVCAYSENMSRINLAELNIKKTQELLQSGEISARELVSIYQENIKKQDKHIHAYLEVFEDAFEQAEAIDKDLQAGNEPKPLSGIPLAIKDNILIKNRQAGAASKILEGYRAVYDSTVIAKLREAGAIFLGRTNMDEFAMGSSTENSAYGPTKNPYDASRVPGGSSGGSAAAVASQQCLAAIGSDTGGSIRQPAAFCGVVGLKPTYGAVSRYGLIAMASSLDQIGPLAKTVEDAEIIFNVIRGKDPKDSTSVESNLKSQISNVKCQDLKIGVPKEYFVEGLEKEVRDAVMEAIEVFKNKGAVVKEISLKHTEYAVAVYYIIATAEASSNLARFDGVQYGYRRQNSSYQDYWPAQPDGTVGHADSCFC